MSDDPLITAIIQAAVIWNVAWIVVIVLVSRRAKRPPRRHRGASSYLQLPTE